MTDKIEYADIPQGFTRALMQNMYAQQYFASLPDHARQDIIRQASGMTSEQAMNDFVSSLVRH